MSERFAIVGLGYVGLPVALAFARKFPNVLGFDIDTARVDALQSGHDWTGECERAALEASTIRFSADPAELAAANFYIVAVPTPIDADRQPDLGAIRSASRTVGGALRESDVVVFESTVYPGVTEEVCGPILAETSGLVAGRDFHLGYSPERINPGDSEHTIERIVKIVSADDAATLDRVATAYGTIVEAGIHRAPSIKVAEAAKVIENTQRDLNIALMNELALIFDKLDIRTQDVLAAAGTKWNFLPFTPGLVGGHCIGVDPYYLTAKAQEVGYYPEVILAGRRINDSMAAHVGQRMVKLLPPRDGTSGKARVGILGLTFKENIPDLRNSMVPQIATALQDAGIDILVHDPMAGSADARDMFGLTLSALDAFTALDGLILAVPHTDYRQRPAAELFGMLRPDGVLIDVRSMLNQDNIPDGITYWSL